MHHAHLKKKYRKNKNMHSDKILTCCLQVKGEMAKIRLVVFGLRERDGQKEENMKLN